MFGHIQTVTSATTARFGRNSTILRADRPLTEVEIRRAAPAVFAEDKHSSRSERYTYIPTVEVLRGLDREGFRPFEVRQGGSADEVKRAHTKHLIRLRRDGTVSAEGTARELVLVNSHDGTGSYQLMSGLFRYICTNGLVTIEGEADLIRIKHKGDIVQNVIDAAYTIVDRGNEIDRRVADMKQIELRPAEQEIFAEAASQLRWDGPIQAPVTPRQVNSARRREDVGSDLWRTFNRAQENLVRGGLQYNTTNDRGQVIARRETRPVQGIDGNTALNRALWVLTSRMQELRAAA